MGGDRAPDEIVAGAADAARADAELELVLVGQEDRVRAALAEVGWDGDNLEVQHASETISMSESPVEALRSKRDSSITRAMALVKSGEASAFLSAGNTGVCVAAATMQLKRLEGVSRAGIAVVLPAGDQPVVVIDAGANVSPKPIHLMHYGIMASLYAKSVLGVDAPRVGLLNVGEEDAKGHDLAKEAHGQFSASDLNFIGNVEGREVFRGTCDVVVCDGFVGNVVLKVSEGLAERLLQVFKHALTDSVEQFFRHPDVAGGLAELPAGSDGIQSTARSVLGEQFAGLKRRFHYSEYGGAPLLGVNGVVTIAHGRSDARAITNAVKAAKRTIAADFNQKLTESLTRQSLSGATENR